MLDTDARSRDSEWCTNSTSSVGGSVDRNAGGNSSSAITTDGVSTVPGHVIVLKLCRHRARRLRDSISNKSHVLPHPQHHAIESALRGLTGMRRSTTVVGVCGEVRRSGGL